MKTELMKAIRNAVLIFVVRNRKSFFPKIQDVDILWQPKPTLEVHAAAFSMGLNGNYLSEQKFDVFYNDPIRFPLS